MVPEREVEIFGNLLNIFLGHLGNDFFLVFPLGCQCLLHRLVILKPGGGEVLSCLPYSTQLNRLLPFEILDSSNSHAWWGVVLTIRLEGNSNHLCVQWRKGVWGGDWGEGENLFSLSRAWSFLEGIVGKDCNLRAGHGLTNHPLSLRVLPADDIFQFLFKSLMFLSFQSVLSLWILP